MSILRFIFPQRHTLKGHAGENLGSGYGVRWLEMEIEGDLLMKGQHIYMHKHAF